MNYFEVFKARHKVYQKDGIGIHNNIEKESAAASEMYFTQIAGYKRAKLNFKDGIDIVTESTKSSLEKMIHLRYSANIENGDYITYTDNVDRKERTYIIRSVNYDQINPIAHGFLCNQSFRLHKDQEPILCYSNSTTFGSKGILETDYLNLLDSKTRIYVKKTDETDSIIVGTRIMFNNKYVYRITECDDVVFPGMLIIVARRDETLVMDDFENNVAYNEKGVVEKPEQIPNPIPDVTITGEDSIKIGRAVEFKSNIDVVWEIGEIDSVAIEEETLQSIKLRGLKSNWITLSAKVDGVVKSTKDIMIYK